MSDRTDIKKVYNPVEKFNKEKPELEASDDVHYKINIGVSHC